jgi:hypothetical protein
MPIELAERSSPSIGRLIEERIFSETLPFFATPFRAILVWSRRSAERRDLRELGRRVASHQASERCPRPLPTCQSPRCRIGRSIAGPRKIEREGGSIPEDHAPCVDA